MISRLALFLVVALSGCTSHSAPPTVDLQMNDLSVMFPLPSSQAELNAMLTPATNANGGPLFPQALLGAPSLNGFNLTNRGLYAVAFRLDPCFGQLGAITDPSTCNAQLRVVFQPLVFQQGSGGFADDAAIHAFYSLTGEQFLDAVRAVQEAREVAGGDTDLGPLAPNSLVAQQGLTGTLAAQLEQVVTTYASAANLVRFTFFSFGFPDSGMPDFSGFWEFDSFDVASGTATPRMIPTLPSGLAGNSMGLSSQPDPLGTQFAPATTSSDNLDVLATYSQASAATPAVLGSAFDAALRIENPNDNSPDTIDCASCHMAQPAIQLVGEPLGLTATGNADAFVPDVSIPAADITQTTMLIDSDQTLNIHAFSYRNTSPMINQRVINETAANLAYVATQL